MLASHDQPIPLNVGVRAILEGARISVTPVPPEVNRSLVVPVDFVTEANGHRSVVKCLEHPEQFSSEDLRTLAEFASGNGVNQLMIIGYGVFSEEIKSVVITLPIAVQLTDRSDYEAALKNLPPGIVQGQEIPEESSFSPKTAFDDMPVESMSEADSDSYESSPAYSSSQGYGAPQAGPGVHTYTKRKSSSNSLLLLLVLIAGAALYFGFPSLFEFQSDEEVVARAVEDMLAEEARRESEINRAMIELNNKITSTIGQARKTAGLETQRPDTAILKMTLAQIGSTLDIGDDVTEQQLQFVLQRRNPTFHLNESSIVEARSHDDLVAKVQSLPYLVDSENSHIGSITKTGRDGKVWAWIFGGIEVDRNEKLDMALKKGGFFSLKCSHCQVESGYELTPHAKYLVMPTCTNCGLAIHVFGPDTEGDYRRACDFLTGFQIPEEKVEEYLPIKHEYREPEDFVLAHWKAILERCDYEFDSTQEGAMERDVWKLPQQTWDEQVGDCEDTTILLADALISAGFEARVAFGTWQGEGHAWCVVKVGQRQRILETTMAHAGAVSLRSIIDVGGDYVAACMFDRDSIYLRKNAGNLSTPDYFSETYWRKMKVNENRSARQSAGFAAVTQGGSPVRE